MATSPIYGWAEPDNTDLVKNGALAIRTLGNAIDTTMATMTPKSIVDAKGDIVAASANDTPARLAVGANGETLVADSSTTTGLRWNPSPTLYQPIINGAIEITQRGTSFTTTGTTAYTLDRWLSRTANPAGSVVTTQELTNDTINLPFIQYCARLRRATGNTNTNPLQLCQSVENSNSTSFIGQTVTFSYYARKASGFTGTFSAVLNSGTGTNESFPNGYTGVATVATSAPTLTTTWTRYSVTGTVSASAKQIGIVFAHAPSGTAGADDYYEVTGAQINLGSIALPFSRAGGTIQGELAACQRYYWRISAANGGNYANYGTGIGNSTAQAQIVVQNPVPMRVTPTSIDYSTLSLNDTATITAATTATLAVENQFMSRINVNVASGLTQFRPYLLFTNNNSAGYLGFSAEL